MVWNEDLGHVLCRAETRGQARRFWPGEGDFMAVRRSVHVARVPWLDGDGPPREIEGVYKQCRAEHDEHGDCPVNHCDEDGWYLDREATLAKLGGS
jgi:hypothetical protein